MKHNIYNIIPLLLIALSSLQLYGQSTVDERTESLRALYQEQVGRYAVVYSGKAQTVYQAGIRNHPYYDSDKYILSTLAYDGLVYDSVYLRLDVVQGELVMLVPENNYGVVLHPHRFQWAETSGYRILFGSGEPKSDTVTGYYVELCGGAYCVVERMEGKIEKEITGMSVLYYFDKKSRFYVEHEGIYYPMKNKNSLLKLFPDRKKELNDWIRERGLNFKQNPRAFLLGLVQRLD